MGKEGGGSMKMLEREHACIELLGKLPKRFVLIGGYATSSFEFPRFSVDLDLVIRENDVQRFSRILGNEGFMLTTNTGDFAAFYKGRFMRFEKKIGELPVSVDLLVDMVQARQTGTAYSFDYLWKNSETRRVIGSGAKEAAQARVASREMLIALKINSMRPTDQRDIIALCRGEVEASKVAYHLKAAPKNRIISNLDIITATLGNPTIKDSIKGVFGIPDRIYEKTIEKAKKGILSIRKILEEGK